jgi:hypothetical protein
MAKDGPSGALTVIVRTARPPPNPWIWEWVDARGAFAGRSRVSYETADQARAAGQQAKAALDAQPAP